MTSSHRDGDFTAESSPRAIAGITGSAKTSVGNNLEEVRDSRLKRTERPNHQSVERTKKETPKPTQCTGEQAVAPAHLPSTRVPSGTGCRLTATPPPPPVSSTRLEQQFAWTSWTRHTFVDRIEHAERLCNRVQVRAFLDRNLVLDPVGDRDVAEEDPF